MNWKSGWQKVLIPSSTFGKHATKAAINRSAKIRPESQASGNATKGAFAPDCTSTDGVGAAIGAEFGAEPREFWRWAGETVALPSGAPWFTSCVGYFMPRPKCHELFGNEQRSFLREVLVDQLIGNQHHGDAGTMLGQFLYSIAERD